MAVDLAEMHFPDAAAYDGWLAENGGSSPGLWLLIAKKDSGFSSVTYAEAVEVSLCHGWIDGQLGKAQDDGWKRQRFTPRTPRSRWSKINVERAEGLIAASRMLPAGLLQVERAKADGRWAAAYASPRNAVVPPELQAILDAEPAAAAAFAGLKAMERYSILYQIEEAKRPETRARRIEKYAQMLRESGPSPS